jgi:hypothetical protein
MTDLGPGSPPQDQVAEPQPSDLPAPDSRPPKQRFKERAQSGAAATAQEPQQPKSRDKRPLVDLLDAAEAEIVDAAQRGGRPEADGASSDGGGGSGSGDGDNTGQRAAAKQPRQVDSLIRNIARPHKPRIGPEFQAELPQFNPQHPRPRP